MTGAQKTEEPDAKIDSTLEFAEKGDRKMCRLWQNDEDSVIDPLKIDASFF